MSQTAVKWMLSDSEWDEIAEMLPVPSPKGGPYGNREILEAIIWIACHKVTWAALPAHFPVYQSVYGRFRKWKAAGVIEPVLSRLGVAMPEPQRPGAKRRLPATAPCAEGLSSWLFAAPH
jgi:hypothetical protein